MTDSRQNGCTSQVCPVDLQGAALAVWVPLGEGKTVEGVRWYHNDEEQAFPQILAVAGEAARPELIPQAVEVASDVSGQSSAWNEVIFEQPLASATSGLYLVFMMPDGGDLVGLGQGGGTGLGYVAGGIEVQSWISFEGELWHPLTADFQMAVTAIMGAAKSGEVLVLGHPRLQRETEEAAVPPAPLIAGMQAMPNPFNPQTEIRFTLPHGGPVDVAVFDIRGRLIRVLHEGSMSAGEHAVIWDGRDRQGRGQASGVYVARLRAGTMQMSCRLTLVQ
jgi:hypothetical protein